MRQLKPIFIILAALAILGASGEGCEPLEILAQVLAQAQSETQQQTQQQSSQVDVNVNVDVGANGNGGVDKPPVDLCPNDPNKTQPGICGCGALDTDRDGDGAMDCVDRCPDDPNKTLPGQCGCNILDTLGCGQHQHEKIYSTDFSSDPAWTTDAPGDYYWDGAGQTYRANMKDNSDSYAVAPVTIPAGQSFHLDFDVTVTRMDWAANLHFGLYSPSRRAYAPFTAVDQMIQFALEKADLGNGISLQTVDSAGTFRQDSEYPTNSWDLNTAYHVVVDFDSPTGVVTARLTRKSDGYLMKSFAVSGVSGFTNLTYIGFTKIGDYYAPGATGSGTFDNLVLSKGE